MSRALCRPHISHYKRIRKTLVGAVGIENHGGRISPTYEEYECSPPFVSGLIPSAVRHLLGTREWEVGFGPKSCGADGEPIFGFTWNHWHGPLSGNCTPGLTQGRHSEAAAPVPKGDANSRLVQS